MNKNYYNHYSILNRDSGVAFITTIVFMVFSATQDLQSSAKICS